MKLQSLLLTLICLGFLLNCKKDLQPDNANGEIPTLPLKEFIYPKSVPTINSGRFFSPGVDAKKMNPADNPITDAGATLGRVLFYDKKLSFNNTVSCGSCHHQAEGFADSKKFSVGFEGQLTGRNANSIVNASMQSSYFWDGREVRLEDMVLKPINNHIEMGIDKIENLDKKLSGTSYYPELFNKAFGSTEISKVKISKALAQFLRSMVSFGSKADQSANLSAQEEKGFQIFINKANCDRCHAGANMRGYYEDLSIIGGSVGAFANIGLDEKYSDKGLGAFQAEKEGYFRVPTLRNIELTAPYMHDGRFGSLEEVVEHYNSGIKNHPLLSLELRSNWDPNSLPLKLNLTPEEKSDLVAFLKTLTDKKLLADERYSDPFVN